MYDRVAASNAWPADLHIALHTNGFNGKVAGTRVHCYPSEKIRRIGRLIQDAIAPMSPGAPDKQVDIEPESVPDSGTLYRVQLGAFRVRENAEAYLVKVRKVLPEAFVTVG